MKSLWTEQDDSRYLAFCKTEILLTIAYSSYKNMWKQSNENKSR
jgi:hypothetical protein